MAVVHYFWNKYTKQKYFVHVYTSILQAETTFWLIVERSESNKIDLLAATGGKTSSFHSRQLVKMQLISYGSSLKAIEFLLSFPMII